MFAFLSHPLRNLIAAIVFVLVTGACGTFAYVRCGWSWGDAFYMVILTIYTVGYNEVRPLDTGALRAITIGLIIFGCTGMLFLTGSLVQIITAAQFNQIFGSRRMQKDIDRLAEHVIICGYGRIGQMLARELKAAAAPFVILERGSDRLADATHLGFLAVQGDATDEDVLKSAGIARARALATVLPDDAANVFITLSARSLNKDLVIIARGEVPTTERKLIQAGADRVVLPTRIGAERISEMLLYHDVSKLLDAAQTGDLDRLGRDLRRLGLQLEVVPAEQGSRAIGATIAEIEAWAGGAFLIVALERTNHETILQPQGAVMIGEGDGVAIVGRPSRALAIEEIFSAATVPAGGET